MQVGNLLIRADASTEIGVGHVTRCIALAEAWQREGGCSTFALATGARELENRIRSHGAEMVRIQGSPGSAEDAAQTSQLIDSCVPRWVVLDGYHFSSEYVGNLKRSHSKLLLMSDGSESPKFKCDIVVDPDGDTSKDAGRMTDRGTKFLAGLRYAMLRREFLDFPKRRKGTTKCAQRVLVTFGGGDLHNVSSKVLTALEQFSDLKLHVTVVLGPTNPYRQALEDAAKRSRHKIAVVQCVQNMPELMFESDFAVTAAGGTCYELCYMRVPMLLITTAKNQEKCANSLGSATAAVAVGAFDCLHVSELAESIKRIVCSPRLRRELARNAERIIDGKGAERIVRKMLQ